MESRKLERLERGVAMKLYQHILIISTLVFLTYYLYGDGLGAIPFLLATIYLIFIGFKELKEWKRMKGKSKFHLLYV